MSISKSTLLAAVAAVALTASVTRADDLAADVAGRLKESGVLAGYRVNVKARSGTVWLEGSVADQKQLATAVGIAEASPGVERVVNRLVIAPSGRSPGSTPLSMPPSTWSLVGGSAPPVAAARATAVTAGGVESRGPAPAAVELAQATAAARPAVPASPSRTKANQPAARQAMISPRGAPLAMAGSGQPAPQAFRPQAAGAGRGMVTPAGQMRGDVRLARGAMPPGPRRGEAVPVGHFGHGGPMDQGMPLTDGQMVPGTMQVIEGGQPIDGMSGAPAGQMGGPIPMGGTGVGMPPVPMRGDGPNVPNYAWPSYSAYPNYAAVQYPTQYSPTAWPYIGPFYPYPQVPLGWRRVSLEWDDGWWWIDFDDRHHHSHHR